MQSLVLMLDRFYKWLAPLIYLPNINPFVSILKSEVFPWAFVFSLRPGLKLPKAYKYFLIYLTVSAGIMVAQGSGLLVPARSLFAIVNASFIFFTLIHVNTKEFEWLGKVFDWVFFANITIGLLQYSSLFPSVLTPIVQVFLDRFADSPEGWGRGVAGLFAEPSYASIAFHYYFAYFMLRKRINQKSVLGISLVIAMAMYDIFIIRSATGLVMISIYFVAHQHWRDVWRGAIVAVVMAVGVLYVSKRVVELPRSIDLTYQVVFDQRYQDFYDFIILESGHRAIGVLGAYNYGFRSPLGAGLGAWPNASITAMQMMGIEAEQVGYFEAFFDSTYDGVRPTSFVAGLMLEGGWIAAVLFFVAFWHYLFRKALFRDSHTRPIIFLFLFNVLLLGTIGDPIPFIFLAFAQRLARVEPI